MEKYTIIIDSSDRILYIEMQDKKLVGVNFMQGAGDLAHFDEFKKNDAKLYDFVSRLMDYSIFDDQDLISKIDEIIWLYCKVQMDREETKTNKND